MPECHTWSMRQGGCRDFLMNMFEEQCSIATQHTASYEAVMLCPAQGCREVSSRSDKEARSDVTAHYT
jgi:hypothetical protein